MSEKPIIKRIYNENNDFQRIEVVKRNRQKRNSYKEFFVEGVKSINYAIENSWHIKSFIYSMDRPLSNWAEGVLQNSKAEVHYELPAMLMDKLSDKDEEPSEILAIISIPNDDPSRIKIKDDMLVVVLDRPSNHGNLGTIIRSCEALKVDGIIVTGHSVDIYDRKTIRASMGTFFAIPIIRVQSHNKLLQWFQDIKESNNDFNIVGSSSNSDTLINDAELAGGPMALVIGNETHGLSYNFKQLCDYLVKIPMYGKITSFNIACATSIMLYEIDRQRNIRFYCKN